MIPRQPFFVLWVLAAPVVADTPDSAFAGIWRMVDVRPAPWAKPHPVTKEEAPLLEYAILFGNGEVKGPAPLTCQQAAFSHPATEPKSLFQGRLPQDKAYELAEGMKLDPPNTPTLRVQCGNSRFDYYLANDGNLLAAVGDVVYTMQRPNGDVSEVKPGYSGPSFDCLQARTALEKLICWDASLSRHDLEMSHAYERLKKTETPESFATVQTAQRGWLAFIAKSCGGNGPNWTDAEDSSQAKNCLYEAYQDRSSRLGGVEALKSGTLILEPRMRFFSKSKPKTEDSDIYPWMSGSPKAKAFNAHIEKILQLAKRRMDDKQLFAFGDDIPDTMMLSARRTYSVARFDERVVSLQISTYDYTGGAHEAIGESSINWDMAGEKPLALEDVFARGKNWRKFVTDFCVKQLREKSSDHDKQWPERKAVEAVVAKGKSWLFAKGHVTVHFSVYEIDSFAGGEYDVDIPYRDLKPYLNPASVIGTD